jgi:hypothetical protein
MMTLFDESGYDGNLEKLGLFEGFMMIKISFHEHEKTSLEGF